MRIGIVTPGFSASEGDWCIPAIRDLVAGLAAADHVRVLTLRYPHRPGTWQAAGAGVVGLGGADRRGLARVPLLLRAVRALTRLARRERLEVLHGLFAHEPGLVATLAGRLLGLPTVVSLLGGELARLGEIGYGGQCTPVNRALVRTALRWAARTACSSEYIAGQARRLGLADRLVRLPLGVDTDRFSAARAADRPVLTGAERLLAVGSLIPVKAPELLLDAFGRLAGDRPDAHLHVVGEGHLRPALESARGELGLAARVHLHGAVPHEELPGWYRQADVCVVSSAWESSPMVALEAAACGVPVVGTAVGVLPEMDGAALTAPVGDPEGLARALGLVLGDPARRSAMAARAAELARGPFSLSASVTAHRRLYAELAGNG
jgi:glycosyltransferase involved in cell wall biosynthesis